MNLILGIGDNENKIILYTKNHNKLPTTWQGGH